MSPHRACIASGSKVPAEDARRDDGRKGNIVCTVLKVEDEWRDATKRRDICMYVPEKRHLLVMVVDLGIKLSEENTTFKEDITILHHQLLT